MPIYEFRCTQCGRLLSLLVHSYDHYTLPPCPRCGQTAWRKLISRVAVLRSEESRLEALADPSNFADLDENDPRSIARWARRLGREMGEDLGPEFHEMVERMEAGELPPEEGAGETAPAGSEDDASDL